ncbi:hypothetical protein A0256_10380 [Mucilaginibacter sp. PAMC 26640]|nr:hypothetical protein A0256_10380 [Mucilaginibacter sp. PAMC 26640]
MFKNLIKTAFRSLQKNKGFTVINILGLALGLATCLLIVFYVADELSYDRYNTNYARIYRVNTDLKIKGTITRFAIAANPVAAALKENFPVVEKTTRITPALNIRFKKGEESISETSVIYSDPGIFDVFTLPMIDGDPKTALTDPHAVVISESIAKKYFNRTNVAGQSMFMITDSLNHKITGVIKDIPAQSHFRADIIMPLNAPPNNNWNGISPFSTYILVANNADPKSLESKFGALMKKNLNTPAFDYDKFEANGNYLRLNLTPLKEIHLQSNRVNELGINGNLQYVYIFATIAVFILLLACINFMNLSTARSANRAREVGVRKVLGSSRAYLVAQFLAESLMVTFTAGVIAILIVWALLPLFNQLADKQLTVTGQAAALILPALMVVVLVVGLLAGSYPAFFLSAFKPINVLKGRLTAGFKGGALRSSLVVLQFAISIFLITSTIVIYNQITYIQNKDLGFNRNQVLVIKNAHALPDPNVFKNEVKKLPGVSSATLTSHLPVGDKWPSQFISQSGKPGTLSNLWPVDEEYLSTMGIKLSEGRDFSKQFLSDSAAAIINETAARILGYDGSPINKNITTGSGPNARQYHIIGVVKDFNFHSLRDNISPLVLISASDWMASLSIKVSTQNLPPLLNKVKATWRSVSPDQQFGYEFMDERFDTLYRTETRLGKLFTIFTSLAIVIACLGLFGLAAYAAEQRSREISIRKVLGAGVSQLVNMLSMDFIRLVIIAIMIATPIAWLVMQKWLQGFAYRQTIQWWVFLAPGILSIMIAFLTVSYQSIKAALINPADSLRGE